MTTRLTEQRQPACLYILFLTEMWERFGFYIVQVLLIFYLTKVYHFSDVLSASILGAFTAISYITPIAGGWLADHYLGFKHSVVLGGLLLSAGYAMLGCGNNDFFYIALAIIAVGTGFFKPNISSYLGNFYLENDDRCERGYTLFYIGINTGIMLATVGSGYLLTHFGWQTAFLSASLGLLIGIIIFVTGLGILQLQGKLKTPKPIKHVNLNIISCASIYACTAATILLVSLLIKDTVLANRIFTLGGTIVLAFLINLALQNEPKQKGNMLACLTLISLSVLFWALYFQLFLSLNLFIDRVLDKNFMRHILPSPIFISLMPLFIMICGPVIGWIWQRLEIVKKNPNTNIKFSLSLFCMAGGLALLTIGTAYPNTIGLINKEWVIAAYLLFALAELLLSPICIAMVIKLIPKQYTGVMMGAYLASIGFGAKLAGFIAGYAAIPNSMQDLRTIVSVYHHSFLVDTTIAIGAGIIMLATKPITNWLQNFRAEMITPLSAEDTA